MTGYENVHIVEHFVIFYHRGCFIHLFFNTKFNTNPRISSQANKLQGIPIKGLNPQ